MADQGTNYGDDVPLVLTEKGEASNRPFRRREVTAIHRLPSGIASCRVFTPRALALAMTSAIHDGTASTWLEPCVGSGVFLDVLHELRVTKQAIRAVDLHPKSTARDQLARTIRGVDFLSWASTTSERFSRIIGNPPYLALHRLPRWLRLAATAHKDPLGMSVPAAGNAWHAFLCASISLLQPRGSLCFLLPAAWDFANYSMGLRESLPDHFGRVEVHRSRKPLFNGVQDGAVVLVLRDLGERSAATERYEYSDIVEMIAGLGRKAAETRSTTTIGSGTAPRLADPTATVRLKDAFQIQIGAVTGDAAYFLLTEAARHSLGIPTNACIPVVSRSRHLTGPILNREAWKHLKKAGERVWLFRPTPAQAKLPSVRSYLRRAQSTGGCRRQAYKVSIRKPWYSTPLPLRIDGFLSGMSSQTPWICLNGMKGLTASNTLYVVTFTTAATLDERAGLCLALLSSAVAAQLRASARHYADGLVKHEPGDFAAVRIPALSNCEGAYAAYREATALLLGGAAERSQHAADAWLAQARVKDRASPKRLPTIADSSLRGKRSVA